MGMFRNLCTESMYKTVGGDFGFRTQVLHLTAGSFQSLVLRPLSPAVPQLPTDAACDLQGGLAKAGAALHARGGGLGTAAGGPFLFGAQGGINILRDGF